MKKTLLFLLLMGPFLAYAQGPCEAVISNISCDGSDLSLNLTFSYDGTPAEISGSGRVAFKSTNNDDDPYAGDVVASRTIFTQNPAWTGSNSEPFYLPTPLDEISLDLNFENESDCDDFVGQTLYLAVRGTGAPCTNFPVPVQVAGAAPEDLPTFGQWGLILFGLGIMSLAVFVLVRNGKAITI